MHNNRVCNEKDLYIAKKLRERRIELGINQLEIAKKLGLTSQQIYKYEKGLDRVPGSRLFEIAKILLVPISFFDANSGKESLIPKEKELIVTCSNMEGEKIKLKILKLNAILVDTKTQKNFDVRIS